MIRYDLVCRQGHIFDGWFSSSAAFDEQGKTGEVRCPQCGTPHVEKQLMMPGIPVKSNRRASTPQTFTSTPRDPRAEALQNAIRELRRYVKEKADYVADGFPEEARRMHYREIKQRGIYGEATLDEARELIEEGIEVRPLPSVPEDHN